MSPAGKGPAGTGADAAGAPAALEFRAVRKRYGPTEVLHGIDLRGGRGEVLAVVGANGAGKSTLIKILAGAEALSSGELLVDGEGCRDPALPARRAPA
ncbi:ATP-binding cassette domain-containing protein, partial [Streptomyces sp. SPB074]|uniref:ATP-binding cassette domain-containing protein n=1 Tax=Streptomyces sp. (strain SPB074) TaxID=465543 RepID=UPI000566A690